RPLLFDVPVRQIDQFQQGHIRCESPLCLGDLTHLTVETLYPIGRVDQFSDSLIVPEIGGQLLPVSAPGIYDHMVFIAPFGLQVVHAQFSLFQGICLMTGLRSLTNSFWALLATYFRLLRIWCTTQVCTSVFGNTASIASANPLRLSMHAIRISSTPRFWRSVRTPIQKLAPSLSETYIPKSSLCPWRSMPSTLYTAPETTRWSSFTL